MKRILRLVFKVALVFLLALVLIYLLSTSIYIFSTAYGRNYGQYAQVPLELRGWFSALKNKKGDRCCDDADGFDAQWDTKDGQYRVYSPEGKWIVVPEDALIQDNNKVGVAKVWWTMDEFAGRYVRCFLRGTEG